jgi:hypothetical protein
MANSLISMIKGDSTLIDNTEVLDGQLLFNTDDKTILLDDGDEREQYGGKSDTANPNIAYVEEGTTATRGYAKGQYVIVSGILYKALVQINSGTTFVVNTNIEQTTVGTELGRTITQEAYDLLPASEKNKGIWYITNSGDSYHVDNALSTTSTNPVRNKILTTEINKINNDLIELEQKVGGGMRVVKYGFVSPYDGDDLTISLDETIEPEKYFVLINGGSGMNSTNYACGGPFLKAKTSTTFTIGTKQGNVTDNDRNYGLSYQVIALS